MPVADQGVTLDRYMLIPRVLIFARRGDALLFIKGSPKKRIWANLYNGVGGHIEQGEDVLSAAKRELFEETGLRAELWLCGTMLVNTNGNPGIGIFIFTGDCHSGEFKKSSEGSLHWLKNSDYSRFPIVEDVPVLLERIMSMQRGDPPFSARSFYTREGKIQVVFS